jgi:hypothetical protein
MTQEQKESIVEVLSIVRWCAVVCFFIMQGTRIHTLEYQIETLKNRVNNHANTINGVINQDLIMVNCVEKILNIVEKQKSK